MNELDLAAGLAAGDLAERRLDKRAARKALASGRTPIVWAGGLVDGLERTLGATCLGLSRRSTAVRAEPDWLARLAAVDSRILRAARQQLAAHIPPGERVMLQASLRNPTMVSDLLDQGLPHRRWDYWRPDGLEQTLRLALAGVLAFWRLPQTLVVVGRPEIDTAGDVPHALDHPAVRWPSESLWFWQGIGIPTEFAARRNELDGREILAERNAERRRVMVDAIGLERFLTTSGASIVQQDDYGCLWRLDGIDREPIVAVEVVNTTAEPDGSRRHYFLRVPPYVRTAREAVAWTFGFASADEYIVAAET